MEAASPGRLLEALALGPGAASETHPAWADLDGAELPPPEVFFAGSPGLLHELRGRSCADRVDLGEYDYDDLSDPDDSPCATVPPQPPMGGDGAADGAGPSRRGRRPRRHRPRRKKKKLTTAVQGPDPLQPPARGVPGPSSCGSTARRVRRAPVRDRQLRTRPERADLRTRMDSSACRADASASRGRRTGLRRALPTRCPRSSKVAASVAFAETTPWRAAPSLRAATTARTSGTGRLPARDPPKRAPRAVSDGGRHRHRLLCAAGCSSDFRAAGAAGRLRTRRRPRARPLLGARLRGEEYSSGFRVAAAAGRLQTRRPRTRPPLIARHRGEGTLVLPLPRRRLLRRHLLRHRHQSRRPSLTRRQMNPTRSAKGRGCAHPGSGSSGGLSWWCLGPTPSSEPKRRLSVPW